MRKRNRTIRALALLVGLLLLISGVALAGTLLQGLQGEGYKQPLQAPTTQGKAFYVSSQGNDANDGSQTHPFASIQQAAKKTSPGTTVHVLPGTYTQPVVVKRDGTAKARITYLSEVKWGAKIKTSGSQAPWTTQADYIDIVGFDITSTGSRDGINNRGSYIRTIGNTVHDIAGGCDSTGGAGIDDSNYQAHDNDIIGNLVTHIGKTYPTMCQYVHGMYHSNTGGHIMNNISSNNAGNGINLWHAATGTVVSNNLTFGNKEHGISIGTDTDDMADGEKGDQFLVANNIVIDNALLGIRERIGVGSHTQYLNNLVYGNGEAPFGDEDYEWPSSTGNRDVQTLTQEAQFVHYALDGSGDYHLQASSPAIGAGTALGAPPTDIDGKPRSPGKGIDIGPYQYR